nr:ribosome biogenesis protein BMS1/TSR1, AARP2CN [Tanacetum cinerariifolium]
MLGEWFVSNKDERTRPTLEEEETIEGVIQLTPCWMRIALKTSFDEEESHEQCIQETQQKVIDCYSQQTFYLKQSYNILNLKVGTFYEVLNGHIAQKSDAYHFPRTYPHNQPSQSTSQSLVLLDNVGAGTNPLEGAVLGLSLLECFAEDGVLLIMATTIMVNLNPLSTATTP